MRKDIVVPVSTSKIRYLTIGKEPPPKERQRMVELPYQLLSERAHKRFGEKPFTLGEMYEQVIYPQKLRLTPGELSWSVKRGVQTGYFKKAGVLAVAAVVALPLLIHHFMEPEEV